MRKICVVTGTRAEYGLLSRLMRMIAESMETELQIIATNMHLSPTYGNTYREIEADGFFISKKIPILDESRDDANSTVNSMAKALSGFAEAYDELTPDLILLLGDRYEILAAATAALIYRIPIAHIHGGEITEGAYDDAIRHAITKMSHLHFTSTEAYRKRVIQLGESPDRVFNVGSLGVENIKKMDLMSKKEIEDSIHYKLDKFTILVTYHPVTLSDSTALHDITEFLEALNQRKDIRIIFTMPNSDTGGKVIIEEINKFVAKNTQRSCVFQSLGVMRYLSIMQYIGAVVGNSSSGIIEVPSFGIPTLNIGDRQKGRISCGSIINCKTDMASIQLGLEEVFSEECKEIAKNVSNPYERANTALSIFNIISSCCLHNIIHKSFYNL